MDNNSTKALCLALMKADTEAEVIKLLTESGFWENPSAWRYYGDYENNYNTIGNQQARPDSALVEKCVNSVDARLMNECLARGMNPESPDAPTSIRHAVARYFDENLAPESELAGRILNWGDEKRTRVARAITLAATGFPPREGRPCFSIADLGEGQTPELIPKTFCSLTESNKLRIPFVQGKFNMGGTGVLKFCGRNKLQFILSRRNPAILGGRTDDPSDNCWGFTLVRREDTAGGGRSSVFTYLAPLGSERNPRHGGVLRFTAESLPIFPDGRNAYAKASAWGTLIKLYEYAATGYSNTHILRKDGLLGRIDLLLPDPALPMRLFECRPAFRGHEGSFETNLTGLSVRLEDDKGENLEEGFPASCPIAVEGEHLTATIYAFKKGRADTYRKNEGLIFTLNGQTHGHLTRDFFNRKSAGRLNFIADSILVMIDCSEISNLAREDLFMNSRDRLSHGELRISLEEKLEEMLRHHDGLRALKERRRNEEIQSVLQDERPLEEILKSLLAQSPTLASLFLQGKRVSNPFKMEQVQSGVREFKGRKHPSFFKFKGKEYGEELHRDCHLGQRPRITFETDAVNDYFSRKVDKGEFELYAFVESGPTPVGDYVGPNLQNGIGSLSLTLPDTCKVGDLVKFEAVVSDPALLDPFRNSFVLKVKPVLAASPGGTGGVKPPTREPGTERELPSGISLPNIIPVREANWGSQNPPFDKYTALRVKISDSPAGNGEGQNGESQDVYDFFINMDNIFLQSELKVGGEEIELINAKWNYGLVLVGLALLHDDRQCEKNKARESSAEEVEVDESETIEQRIEQFSRALAPVLLPMINTLGTLEPDAILAATASGEAT